MKKNNNSFKMYFLKPITFLIILIFLVSCEKDYTLYPFELDAMELNSSNNPLYIESVDFRYLEKGNKNNNSIVFYFKPIDPLLKLKEMYIEKDIIGFYDFKTWIVYKGQKYETFQTMGSFFAMVSNVEGFNLECSIELMDENSELYLLFQRFDDYSKKEKIEQLKKELPKIKVFIKVNEETLELPITSKTKAVYTKVATRMRDTYIIRD
ncbi:MAG: hypothetical protein LBI72_13775 [Flavobacteriaceae bacterium]|jgi:hypothetical protein|nr:hypothetical protein [Flavobacteriaceae bacterium]